MGNLICSNIKKEYKNNVVLNDVNLTIEQGKIYGLIGRNGAGKTTLLSIMTAQNPADKGNVMYDGMQVWENREALDHICFSREISTTTVLGPNKTKVKDYFKTASFFYPNWDENMASELVKKFGINPKKSINKLSKGMLSMLTIIIGLASKSDITILDEPVAGLDVVAREEFYKILLEEQIQTGRTFIISTHIIEEAADIFEEVIILDKGSILLKENTQELLERCVYVTGLADNVDRFVQGKNVINTQSVGRSKSVTVMFDKGENINCSDSGLTIQPVSLQNLFVAMCGGNGGM